MTIELSSFTILIVIGILAILPLALLYLIFKTIDKKYVFLTILLGVLFVIWGFALKNMMFDITTCRTSYVNVGTYEIIKGDTSKDIEGQGNRYRFEMTTENKFNFYYKSGNAIRYKTIDFDFPIYEDQDNRMYVNEKYYKIKHKIRILNCIELHWEKDNQKKYVYELHMPKGQFEQQKITLN